MIGLEKKTGTWRPGREALCGRSETWEIYKCENILGNIQDEMEWILPCVRDQRPAIQITFWELFKLIWKISTWIFWTNILFEMAEILIPCWMSTSMGGVGVLDVAWRPEKHLISIWIFFKLLFCYDDHDDYDEDGGHLQVMIGGALASPPAPDPPSSFKLEISWKKIV